MKFDSSLSAITVVVFVFPCVLSEVGFLSMCLIIEVGFVSVCDRLGRIRVCVQKMMLDWCLCI